MSDPTSPTVQPVVDDSVWGYLKHSPLFGGALMLMGVLVTSYTGLLGSNTTANSDVLKTLIEAQAGQMARLEDQLAQLRYEYREQEIELLAMASRLFALERASPEQTLRRYLDSMPGPAWCKYKDEGVFRMMHVNAAYTRATGITNAFYQNKTDMEVWGEEIGGIYLQGDSDVYARSGSGSFIEPMLTADGERVTHLYWKFYFKTITDRHLVCGIQIDAVNEE